MVYHGSSRLIMPEIHYCRWMDSEWRLILFGNYCVISSPVRFKHNHGYIMVANMISNRLLTHICLSHIFLFFYINGVRKGCIIVIMILSGVTMATIIIFNHNVHLETWLWIKVVNHGESSVYHCIIIKFRKWCQSLFNPKVYAMEMFSGDVSRSASHIFSS